MKALKQINKTVQSFLQPAQPLIYHFRVTKALTSQNVPYCIDKLRAMRESKAPQIFALSINVNCGSPVLTKTLREALIQTASDLKAPLYTFAEDTALESGFYLLSAGHKIYANPYSLLGDVASIEKEVKIEKLVRRYVNVTLVKSGKYKNLSLNLEETSPETEEFLNKLVKVRHDDMVEGIFESRDIYFERKGMRSDSVRQEVLDGRTFTAKEALNKGLIDDIMTFEEFKDKYYKDYKLQEFTVDKDENLGYEQIAGSVSNWMQILSGDAGRSDSVLESYSNEQVRAQVELAQDMLHLLKSEKFVEKLKTYVSEELVGEVYENIQGRMSMADILDFLDQSDVNKKGLLSGKI